MASTGSIFNTPSAELQSGMAWARQRGAVRLQDVDAYLGEVWRLATELGYDPAIVAAQSSLATSGWTEPAWRDRLNPAAIGIQERAETGLAFASGIDAARAHMVHLTAYVTGYEPQIQPFIHLDPLWQSVFESGHEGSVRTTSDLAGRWSPDPRYGHEIITHLEGIISAVRRPEEVVALAPHGTPPPACIHYHETGNWSERRFGQQPMAIVFHLASSPNLDQLLTWYQNPVSRASHHAIIDRTGGIHLMVDAERAAWSNDDIKNPRRDIGWLNAAVASNWSRGGPMSLNDFTLSIEYIASTAEPPSEAQYRAMIELATYWQDLFEIPANRGRLIRHSDINSVDRMHCPGSRFSLGRVIEALGGSPEDLGA